MAVYTATLTISITAAVGNAAPTAIDEAYLVALVSKKINELNYATAGTAMILVTAVIS